LDISHHIAAFGFVRRKEARFMPNSLPATRKPQENAGARITYDVLWFYTVIYTANGKLWREVMP
jgi:hypothetical protein